MKNKLFSKNVTRSLFWFFSILLLNFQVSWGQTYFDMSTSNYTQNFNAITALPTNFSTVAILTTGSIPVATKTTVASTSALVVVGSGAAVGIDAATSTRLVFLTTGATINTTAIATDLNLNFSNRNAGVLSFDASTIFNGTGDRVGSLRVYYSTDNTNWSELTGTNLPYVATNNVAGSGNISIALPTALNNQSSVKLRFYYHNGTANGTTGSRPRIGIDNLSVTSTAAVACTPQTITALSSPVTKSFGDSHSIATTASSGLVVTYSSSNNSVASVDETGNVFIIGIGGPITLTASQAGNGSTVCLATPVTQSLTVTKATPTITSLPSATSITYGQTLSSVSLSGGTVSVSGTFTFTTPSLLPSVGTAQYSVTFTPDDSAYYNTTTTNINVIVNAKALTITANDVSKPEGTSILGGPGSLAFTSSGLLIGESIGSVTITYGTGSASEDLAGTYVGQVSASAATGGSFSPSNYTITYISGTITVSAGALITGSLFTTPNFVSATYGSVSNEASFTVSGSNMTEGILVSSPDSNFEVSLTSGGSFTDTVLVGAAGNISQTLVYIRLKSSAFVNTYTGSIVLTSAGATTVLIPVATSTVIKATPTIDSLPVSSPITYGQTLGASNLFGGSASVPGQFIFTTFLTLPNAGTGDFDITFVPTAVDNFNSVQGLVSVTVNKADQTLSGIALTEAKVYGDVAYSASSTASSGLVVSYSSSDTNVATVDSNGLVSIVGVGTSTITASQFGDSNYNAASSVTQELTVVKGEQTITLASTDAKTTLTTTYSLLQNASSGLAIVYTSSNAAVATISGNTVTIVGAGETTITANQSGDLNYNAALEVTQSLTVTAVATPIVGWNMSTQTGGVNNFGTSPLTPNTSNSNATNGSLTRGYGVNTIGTAAARGWGGLGWNYSTADLAIAANRFITFTTKASSGYTLSLNSLNPFGYRASSTGATSVALQYQINSDSFTTITTFTSLATSSSGGTFASTDLSGITALQNLPSSTTVTFRIVPFGASGTGTFYIYDTANSTSNDLVINGFVNQLPAPSITSSLTATGTVGTAFTYATAASNSPESYSASGLPSGLSINTSTGVISGTPTTVGSSSVTLSATNVTGTDTKTLELTVGQGTQTITFVALAPITYGATSFSLNGASSSGLPLIYTSLNTTVATISGNTVTIVGAGSTSITASQSGDANYIAASDVSQDLVVAKANQTITFNTLPAKNDVDGSFTLGATASSGLTVSYSSSNTNVVSIIGNSVTIVAPGTSIITASQAGNANYNPAISVDQEQTIINTQLSNQTITFGPLSTVTYGDASFILNATVDSPLTITYISSDTTVASVSGDTVTIHKPGTVTITASQDGNSVYNPAEDVTQSLVVTKKGLNATNVSVLNKAYDGTTAATLTADLGGLIATDEVILNNAAVFATADAGTGIAVTANLSLSGAQADRYEISQPTGLTADITLATQVISFGALADKTYGDAAFNLFATGGSSGSPIVFTSSDPLVATVLGNTVTIVGVGPVTITASQAGNSNYNPAVDVSQLFTINKANQTITFNALVNRTTADNSFTLGGFASSNLALSYASSNAAVASISGTLVTIVGPGSTTITVSQAGNNLYNAATDVNQTQIILTAISKWTFEGITTNNTGSNAVVSDGSAIADQGLQTSGTLFSANHASAFAAWTNPAGNGSAKSVTSNNWATGDYYELKLNTSNYHDLSIAFDQTGSNTGPSTFRIQYSLNGTSFTDLGSSYSVTNDSWNNLIYKSVSYKSFDLSAITTLNNTPSVFIRIVNVNITPISGTFGTGGTNRLDNFVLTGIACNTSAGITNNTNTNVLTCDAATIALTATGGTSYSWSNGTNVVGTSENLSVTAAGTYTVTVSTDNGCSSSASLVINQNTTTTSSETQTACNSYTWNETVYTESGVYTYSSTSTSGCTNIATLNLTINTSSTNTTTTSAVGTYTWANNDQTYTSSGVYTGTTLNCVTQLLDLTITPLSTTLSLQVFLDGYYINSSNPSSMRPARYNNLVESGSTNTGSATDVDFITVELRSPSNLNVVAYTASPILKANGSAQCVFPLSAIGGSYYIVVKHRAAIPLWSANLVTLSASSAFSFANNSINAYSDGSMTPMHTLISSLYGIWLGALNDDGYLDGVDYASFETDSYLSQYGGLYLLDGDLNGDSYVDASDYAVFDFNSTVGVYEQRPY